MENAKYDSEKGITTVTYKYSEDLHGKDLSFTFNTSLIPQLASYNIIV